MNRSTLSTPNATRIAFDFGSVLGYVAGKYKNLMKAVQEAVQNSLDAEPTRVNLVINLKASNIYVQDDGVGASIDHMQKCLSRIGRSAKGKDKLGQFGIGVVAAFGKCRRFSFTSEPADKSNPAQRWVFDCKALSRATTSTSIPMVGTNISDQWWNSELEIEGFAPTAIKSKIDLDELCDGIYKSFARAMKKHGTTITVRLTTKSGEQLPERQLKWIPFQGKPIKTKSYVADECGTTTFRMFVVHADERGKRLGQGVRVVDSTKVFSKPLLPKLFPNGDSGASWLGRQLCKDISTHFEGEIEIGDKVELNPDREHFEDDEASMETCLHIHQWFEEVGKKIKKSIDDAKAAERYRDLGDESLKVMDQFLKDADEAKGLAKLLKEKFKWGSQGVGHSVTGAKTDGSFTGRSTAGGAGGTKVPGGSKKKKKKKAKTSTAKPQQKPNHTPMVVDRPDGNKRVLTQHDSTGLRIAYEGGGGDLWDLDKEQGILTINIAHDTWANLDKEDVSSRLEVRSRLLCQLQEKIIQSLFTVLAVVHTENLSDEVEFVMMHTFHEDHLKYGWSLLNADRLAGRGRFNRGKKD